MRVHYGTLSIPDDLMAEDIFSQAAKAMRARHGSDPLAGLPPQLLIASGHSQSTVKLAGYYNTIQHLHGLFSGFLLRGAQNALRQDVPAKVMRVYSETDVGPEVTAASSNKDTAPDTDTYRRWDISGTSHASYYEKLQANYLQARDRGTVTPAACVPEPYSRLPYHYAHNAAYHHLARWITDGTPPPASPRIRYQADGLTLQRDMEGFVVGGYRMPELTVPRAVNRGDNTGAGLCFLYGSYEPFTEPVLQLRYPTRAGYVGQLDAQIVRSVQDGFLLAEDARQVCQDARQADLGWAGSAAALPPNMAKCPV